MYDGSALCGAGTCVFQRGCGARLGTLRFGRVERHAALEALGRVVRHGVGLLIREHTRVS